MNGGARTLALAGCLAVANGCTANHELKVRPIADAGARFRQGGDLLAQARADLALGNAGTALEGFRKLQHEEPENKDMFAGIAACYAAMGRYDLARANYEFALAYAPNDAGLLNALASALDRLGESGQATQVRAEAASLALPPAVGSGDGQGVTRLGVPRTGSITVALPPARELAATPAPAKADAGPSARTVLSKRSATGAEIKVAVAEERKASAGVSDSAPQPPHLERLSPGEVALITTPQPPEVVPPERTAVARAIARVAPRPAARPIPTPRELAAVAVRWALLPSASAARGVRLLNAARSEGLAARTRSALLGGGWSRIGIGNAQVSRQHSLVLYAPQRAALAHRLATQFRWKAVQVTYVRGIVVLLGRDEAARHSLARA